MEIPPNAWKLMSCPVPRRCWSMIFYLREIPKNKPPRPYIGWCSVWGVFIGPNLFLGFFSRKGGIFGICRSSFCFFFWFTLLCSLLIKIFSLKNRLVILLYKYNFNIAIMQHNLLAIDRIKLTTIREILGLMASRQVEKAPSDGISPAEEKLDFDDATLRGN